MKPEESWIEKAKRDAAIKAVKLVENNQVMGLGSGSTAAYVIQEIGKRIQREKIRVSAVPTSYQALTLAVKHGIRITTLEEHPTMDLTIDGADQIDDELNLIKGMGAALTREKIVASASKKLIIVADERKRVKFLGENNHPLPIEIVSFATPVIMQKMEEMGGNPILRESSKKVGPVITDNGNLILDVNFGVIRQPEDLEKKLKRLPGVVETGLFIKMAESVYIGGRSGVEKLEKK